MSFNIENGGADTNTSPQQFADFILQLPEMPDIICFQETWYRKKLPNGEEGEYNLNNIAQKISDILNMNFIQANEPYGVGIATNIKIQHIFNIDKLCGCILQSNKTFCVFNVHMNDFPGYHNTLKGLEYYGTPFLSKEESIKLSWENRKADLDIIFEQNNIVDNIIIAGDFNEPSHLDENVEWYTSKFLQEKGFIDTCRYINPNKNEYPGFTCDVIRKTDIKNPPIRIDFIYTKNIKIHDYITIKKDISDHLPIMIKFE